MAKKLKRGGKTVEYKGKKYKVPPKKQWPATIAPRKTLTEPQFGGYTGKADKNRKALKPGLRVSKSGNLYYAYRKDHSDRKKKL